MPDYPWEPGLPAAVIAVFQNHLIANEVVITGGVAMADWWYSEHSRHEADGQTFTLAPRLPTRDIDTVVRVGERDRGSTHINVVISDPQTLQRHLEERGWRTVGNGTFTCANADYRGVTIDLVTYRSQEGHQQTVGALVPAGESVAGGSSVAVARVLPPCLKEMYFVQPFGHTPFAAMGLRRHNHPGLLLAKLSAVGTNLTRWRQAAAGAREAPADLQRLAKDAKDLTDLLHLQVRSPLQAYRETFEQHLDQWAWCVRAYEGGLPSTDPPGHSMSRARIELGEAERALAQWLHDMRLADQVERANPAPPLWAGTRIEPRRSRTTKDLSPPPV